MKPAAFDYVRCDSAEQAVQCLAQHGDQARILAGGQSLMPMLNMRLAQPALLIDISRSEELAFANRVNSGPREMLEVGASMTQARLMSRPDLAMHLPLLAQAMPFISHFQVRNRGTVCGSIAHADPSAELPLCLQALQGEVVLLSARGQRIMPAKEFFTGLMSTQRAGDELLHSVRFPVASTSERFAFCEFSRRHGDFALCAVAVVAHSQGIRIAVGGISDLAVTCEWPRLEGEDLDDALNTLAWQIDARDDAHMSASGRRHWVRSLGRQAVQAACKTAKEVLGASS